MIVKRDAAKLSRPFEGVTRRVMANSANLMLCEHILEEGAVLPDHHHPHEQLVYLKEGQISVEMGGETLIMTAGDSLVIPPDVSHKVVAKVRSVALDIFSPTRQDYL